MDAVASRLVVVATSLPADVATSPPVVVATSPPVDVVVAVFRLVVAAISVIVEVVEAVEGEISTEEVAAVEAGEEIHAEGRSQVAVDAGERENSIRKTKKRTTTI